MLPAVIAIVEIADNAPRKRGAAIHAAIVASASSSPSLRRLHAFDPEAARDDCGPRRQGLVVELLATRAPPPCYENNVNEAAGIPHPRGDPPAGMPCRPESVSPRRSRCRVRAPSYVSSSPTGSLLVLRLIHSGWSESSRAYSGFSLRARSM